MSAGESDPDRVWFVPLASVRDPALALPTIATALGLRQQTARTAEESLRAFLRGRRALLVLDNVEQIVPVGPLLTRLLAACPGLTMLATSRVPLRVSGEFLFTVPPLPLQDEAATASGGTQADAVRLFVARAEAVDSSFRLTAGNSADVAAICRQLDGLPLAIELAAARVATLPLSALRDALRHRLPLLTGGPGNAPARLRTMRDAIAWSHDLLAAAGQRHFRRLTVFTGGFTLDAAACVLGDAANALDGVASLVGAHLVERAETVGANSRFTMLETIREFGQECLAASGEESAIRARHAGWFLAQAERADYSWYMPLDDAEPLIAGLAADHANLRAAHDWFVQTGDTEAELLLAGRLGALWVLLGQCQEGRDWLEQALDRNASASTPGRARALAALTLVAHRLRDFPRTLAAGAEGLALARRVADVSRVGKGPANVAGTLAATGQHALAARLFGASEAYHEVTGYRFGPDAFDRQRALGLPEPWQAAGEPFGTLAPLRAAVEARGTARFPDIPDRALVEVEWAAGRGLAVDDAIALALAAEPVTPAPDPFGTLSTREREVLRMLIDGCPTREIAAALSLSERTVEGHVQHVLDKLGAPSRTAAIVLALRHGFG